MSDRMTAIITMAGLGTRFRAVGYKCPKYMIEVKGRTLFEWSMDSLKGYHNHIDKYIFAVRAEDKAALFIKEKCAECGITNIQILELDHMTDGQATTCLLALPYCDFGKPVMVYNIDTYVEPYELKYEDICGDGYIPCFHAPGEHWSFVRLDADKRVVEIREKKRISDNCTLGAYYFSSARLYQSLYDEYYVVAGAEENSERYIAPLYNWMIEKGMDVRISIVDARKVHVLGTPEEVMRFKEGT